MKIVNGITELAALDGTSLGSGEWVQIGQREIDLFAQATGDHQWIHIDPERAATGPYGVTIAHGFLTLALIPQLMSTVIRITGITTVVNYGLNKVRFITPVRVGAKVRASAEVLSVEKGEGFVQLYYRTTIDLLDSQRPAALVEQIGRYFAE